MSDSVDALKDKVFDLQVQVEDLKSEITLLERRLEASEEKNSKLLQSVEHIYDIAKDSLR